MPPTTVRKLGHKCTLPEHCDSIAVLHPPRQSSGFWHRFWHYYKRVTLISEHNPRCGLFYRSRAEITLIKIYQTTSKSIIIHPLSMFRLYYEIFMALVLICALVWMPLQAAFGTLLNTVGVEHVIQCVLSMCLTIACVTDIVMTFITGFCNEKEKTITMEPFHIARNYVIGIKFICDIVCAFPDPGLIAEDVFDIRLFEMLYFLKVVRFKTAYRYISRTAEFLRCNNRAFSIMKLFFFIFLVFHYVACLQYLVPQVRLVFYREFDEKSWVIQWHMLTTKDSLTKYSKSFYRSVGYMLCVRFDPVIVQLWEELFLACVTYSFGKFFMLYVTVKLAQIMIEQTALETKYEELMEQVDAFMVGKTLPVHLRKKIVQNYDYKYRKVYFKENKITALLPDQLRREVNAEVLVKLSRNVTIFQGLRQWKLEQVLAHLKPEIFMPNDLIFRAGSSGDCMYFLSSGTVCVFTPSGKEVCHLSDGDYFGEICIVLKDVTRISSVIALEISEVYKMSKKGFYMCFKTNKDLLKKIKDQATERMEMTQTMEDICKAQHEAKKQKASLDAPSLYL